MTRTVLVIDDEQNMRWVLERALEKAGYDVFTAERGDQGLQLFARHRIDLVLLDLKMPGMDGLTVLRELRQRSPRVPILLLTAYATVPTAVEALQLGASDYLRKPFDLETVLFQISRFLARQAEEASPQEHAPPSADFIEFVGAAPALSDMLASAASAVQMDAPVLLLGEEGTGRRHLARLIHANTPGPRGLPANGRLVYIDCAALPRRILEQSLLKGSEVETSVKAWQQALGGTLLLANADALEQEVSEPLSRNLCEYLRSSERPHGLRLLLTAKSAPAPAWSAILTKTLTIQLPPLRARMEDLPLLLSHFAPQVQWSQEARTALESYDWPGNVAELRRVVLQAAHLAREAPVQIQHLPSHLMNSTTTASSIFVLPTGGIDLEEVEVDLIRQAIAMTHGNKTQTARLLGLSRATLLYRLSKYAIEDPE